MLAANWPTDCVSDKFHLNNVGELTSHNVRKGKIKIKIKKTWRINSLLKMKHLLYEKNCDSCLFDWKLFPKLSLVKVHMFGALTIDQTHYSVTMVNHYPNPCPYLIENRKTCLKFGNWYVHLNKTVQSQV